MSNITDADVKLLVPDTSLADTSPYIDMAQLIVDTYVPVGTPPSGLVQPMRDLIVQFLSAHIVVLTDELGGLIEGRASDVTERYNAPTGKTAAGFGSTRFGQNALALDSTGALKKLSNPDMLLNSAFIHIRTCGRYPERAWYY